MTPKNKFYSWKEYFSFFQNKDKKMSLLRMLVKNSQRKFDFVWIRSTNFYCFYPNHDKQRSFYARGIWYSMFCLSSYRNLKFTVPNFFCLGPLVWNQFILLMLSFFHTISLGAVDYKMVDSAVRKKPSKARDTYKVYSDKDFLNWKKCKHLRYPVYSKNMEKDKWKHGSSIWKVLRGSNKRWRPCLLGNNIDPLGQKYVKAIATAKALTKRCPL